MPLFIPCARAWWGKLHHSQPDFAFLFEQVNVLKCTCCGWQGQDKKAKKHYLIVGKIAEVELYCPECKHYLGFISEPLNTDARS
jgi:hypothetical protein